MCVLLTLRLLALTVVTLTLLLALSGLGPAEAVTLTPGDLIVGDTVSPVQISTVNPTTGAKTVICACTILSSIRDVAVKGTEKIYASGVLLSGLHGVVEFDPATGNQRVVASWAPLQRLGGIAVEANGNILVTEDGTVSSTPYRVVRVDPSSGQKTTVSTGNRLSQPYGIAVGPSGQIFVVAQIVNFPAGVLPQGRTTAYGVLRIDPSNGQQTVVAYGDQFDLAPIDWTEIIGPEDVFVAPDNMIYVRDARVRGTNLRDEVRLIKVDPATGAQTMLSKTAFKRY